MRIPLCTAIVLLLWPGSLSLAATPRDKPDKEMIRLLEFLQQWDMIKDLDLMRELSVAEAEGEHPAATSSRKELPVRKKDTTK